MYSQYNLCRGLWYKLHLDTRLSDIFNECDLIFEWVRKIYVSWACCRLLFVSLMGWNFRSRLVAYWYDKCYLENKLYILFISYLHRSHRNSCYRRPKEFITLRLGQIRICWKLNIQFRCKITLFSAFILFVGMVEYHYFNWKFLPFNVYKSHIIIADKFNLLDWLRVK